MARKFLYVIAALVVLMIAAFAIYAVWGMQLIRAVMVPREDFAELAALPPTAYDDPKMWVARPDITQNNPALWTPAGVTTPAVTQKAAIFFLHPTMSPPSAMRIGMRRWTTRIRTPPLAAS